MTNKPKFTPGFWQTDGLSVKAFGRGTIAKCTIPHDEGVFEYAYNVHLIAAAPELYEALDLAQSTLQSIIINRPQGEYAPTNIDLKTVIDVARAALTKIRGETQP